MHACFGVMDCFGAGDPKGATSWSRFPGKATSTSHRFILSRMEAGHAEAMNDNNQAISFGQNVT